LRRAYKTNYRRGLKIEDVINELSKEASQSAVIQLMLEFIQHSERGIAR